MKEFKTINTILVLACIVLCSGTSLGQDTATKNKTTELSTFHGEITGPHNTLSWITASGRQCASFVLQRSNCTQWEDIAILASKDTSDVVSTYYYLDTDYIFPNSLYRLKCIHFDGTSELSSLVSISRLMQNEIYVWPNPATNEINVQQAWQASENIHITDMTGKDVTNAIIKKEGCLYKTTWEISSLVPGMYFIITDKRSYKFIKG